MAQACILLKSNNVDTKLPSTDSINNPKTDFCAFYFSCASIPYLINGSIQVDANKFWHSESISIWWYFKGKHFLLFSVNWYLNYMHSLVQLKQKRYWKVHKQKNRLTENNGFGITKKLMGLNWSFQGWNRTISILQHASNHMVLGKKYKKMADFFKIPVSILPIKVWQLKVIVSEKLVFSLIDSTHSKPIWEAVASTMIMWSCSQNPRMSQYSNQGQRIKIYLVRYNNLLGELSSWKLNLHEIIYTTEQKSKLQAMKWFTKTFEFSIHTQDPRADT